MASAKSQERSDDEENAEDPLQRAGHGKTTIELSSFRSPYASQNEGCKRQRNERIPVDGRDGDERSEHTEYDLESPKFFAKANGQSHLAAGAVAVHVAQIVDRQQSDGQATDREACHDRASIHRQPLYIVRAADSHESEKNQDKQFAEAVVGERIGTAGIRVGSYNRCHADDDERPSGAHDQRDAANR